MKHWLFKTEPSAFSIEDLEKDKTTPWDGIRNYQARNFMRKDMKVGDLVFVYHSSCKRPGIVGLAKVCKEAYPDYTAWEENQKYFDPKSTPDNPRWFMVDISYEKTFQKPLYLDEMRELPALEGMPLFRKGMRLSIQPVSKENFAYILELVEEA